MQLLTEIVWNYGNEAGVSVETSTKSEEMAISSDHWQKEAIGTEKNQLRSMLMWALNRKGFSHLEQTMFWTKYKMLAMDIKNLTSHLLDLGLPLDYYNLAFQAHSFKDKVYSGIFFLFFFFSFFF